MCLMEEHRLVTLLAKLAPLSCAPSSTEQLTLFPVMLCTSEQTPQRATLSPCGDAAGACEGEGGGWRLVGESWLWTRESRDMAVAGETGP